MRANTLKMEKERWRGDYLIRQALMSYHSNFSLISNILQRSEESEAGERVFKMKSNAQRRRRRPAGDWRTCCPLEMCLKQDVNFMPSYTCANFYIRFVIRQSLYIYHEVYLYSAFN